MQVQPLSARFGAEVRDLDLSRDVDDEAFGAIHRLFVESKLLCFKNQNLSAAAQLAFSSRFGPLEVHVLSQYNHPEHPEIFRLSNRVVDGKPMGIADGGSYWHSDLAFQERPAKATILNALEIPPEGGDTLFADMEAAYEALSDEWKARLDGLRAVHRYRRKADAAQSTRVEMTEAQKQQTPDVDHPLIRTNPDSGRKAIFAHPGMTAEVIGQSPQDSREILEFLFAHTVQPQFRYDFRWSPGDVVMWDNRSTMHSATTRDLPAGQYRTLYRTTVRGERPV
ncbi:TauD/TfdA family dioxygenase [Hydrogenophaga borbori]|uniref:TauD/TfdA family dioxygenase n=1 Tax=Hydrogenophaga borbori TaxID=2294117 RepID=A0A372EJE9_9BURK|nr:TauD/TfdA family dioxygenase [Hydrogenophaga borbori]RFP78776.1 TauD/TfdA family dioxygenase [Hydrogenophaga borbori]